MRATITVSTVVTSGPEWLIEKEMPELNRRRNHTDQKRCTACVANALRAHTLLKASTPVTANAIRMTTGLTP